MSQIASELLAKALAQGRPVQPAASLRWRTWDLGTPRVDLEDKEAVRVALDEHA